MSLEVVSPERHRADGQYAAESVGVADLRDVLALSGAFNVYNEVSGIVEFRQAVKEDKSVRIDMILAPTQKLLEAGWKDHGQVGVECKRSGERLAPAVAQARDYSRSVFALRNREDSRSGPLLAWVRPQWFFIWPFNPPGGDLESLMAADGIGVVNLCKAHPTGLRYLRFKVGSYNMLEVHEDGQIHVNRNPTPGRKVGCR